MPDAAPIEQHQMRDMRRYVMPHYLMLSAMFIAGDAEMFTF